MGISSSMELPWRRTLQRENGDGADVFSVKASGKIKMVDEASGGRYTAKAGNPFMVFCLLPL